MKLNDIIKKGRDSRPASEKASMHYIKWLDGDTSFSSVYEVVGSQSPAIIQDFLVGLCKAIEEGLSVEFDKCRLVPNTAFKKKK